MEAYFLVIKLIPGVVAGSRPSRSMTCASKSLLHAFVGAGQDVGVGSHRPSNQDRLTCQLVVHWNQRMVGWKCSAPSHASLRRCHSPKPILTNSFAKQCIESPGSREAPDTV